VIVGYHGSFLFFGLSRSRAQPSLTCGLGAQHQFIIFNLYGIWRLQNLVQGRAGKKSHFLQTRMMSQQILSSFCKVWVPF